MKKYLAFALAGFIFCSAAHASRSQWSAAQANAWYARQPWLVGSNFVPKNAENQLEMWQAETFDAAEIDHELQLAQNLGMTTVRVFLHDLLWQADAKGFTGRIDTFLALAAAHHIRPLMVLFDSCWAPNPQLGPQAAPVPGVHNSRWVQSPGIPALLDANQTPRLQAYVTGVVSHFAKDARILAWDVWNEPDNTNDGSYHDPQSKIAAVQNLLPQVFAWVRSANPTQPLTSGVWYGDWSSDSNLTPIQFSQLHLSDIISFHNYGDATDFSARVANLVRFGRPMMATEYMARPQGSTFQAILPIAKANHLAMFNWGFVAGKTQTYIPWDSWTHPYTTEPAVWFHDVFRNDGTPYRSDETDFIRSLLAP